LSETESAERNSIMKTRRDSAPVTIRDVIKMNDDKVTAYVFLRAMAEGDKSASSILACLIEMDRWKHINCRSVFHFQRLFKIPNEMMRDAFIIHCDYIVHHAESKKIFGLKVIEGLEAMLADKPENLSYEDFAKKVLEILALENKPTNGADTKAA